MAPVALYLVAWGVHEDRRAAGLLGWISALLVSMPLSQVVAGLAHREAGVRAATGDNGREVAGQADTRRTRASHRRVQAARVGGSGEAMERLAAFGILVALLILALSLVLLDVYGPEEWAVSLVWLATIGLATALTWFLLVVASPGRGTAGKLLLAVVLVEATAAVSWYVWAPLPADRGVVFAFGLVLSASLGWYVAGRARGHSMERSGTRIRHAR